MDEFEQKLKREIEHVQSVEEKCKRSNIPIPLREALGKSSLINEGFMAGLFLALQSYQEFKSQT
jgi:hypothetical protein